MLPQKSAYQERKLKLRWLVMMSTLPLLGVVTAFGLAPQSDSALSREAVIEQAIQLPTIQAESVDLGTFWHSERIKRGDTVSSLLRRLNVSDQTASEFLRRAPETESLRKLKVGKEVQVEITLEGRLVALRYLNNEGNQTVISRIGEQFDIKVEKPVIENKLVVRSGQINHSLYGATDAAGLPDSVANQLAELFGNEIDFREDLRKGDHFAVVYEATYSNGMLVKTGRIQAAEFVNRGKSFRTVYFAPDGAAKGSYYTPEGKTKRKAFLRSPLTFSRVSSGFTTARFHPVLKRWRAHKGVDFAAPTGTPIRSTGAGVVATVEYQNGYGNVISINHPGGYTTLYGHMSRFAKGIRRGQKIEQGELIGYVGATGLASGPHLHYEFKVNGQHKDPMSIALPVEVPLTGVDMAKFKALSKDMVARLDSAKATQVAKAN